MVGVSPGAGVSMVGISLGDGISMVGVSWGAGVRASGTVGAGSTGARLGGSTVGVSAVPRSGPGGRVVSSAADGVALPDRAAPSRQRGHNPAGASRGNAAPQSGQVGWALIGGSPRG